MGFLTGAKHPLPQLFIEIGLFDSQDGISACAIDGRGESAMVPFLTPAYFDKVISNQRGPAGEELLGRAHKHWQQARERWPDEGATFTGAVALIESGSQRPQARVQIIVQGSYDKRLLGVNAAFKPMRSWTPTVGELVNWALWDWTVATLESEQLRLSLDTLLKQCDYYRAEGLPRLRDVGKAPFLAAMATTGGQIGVPT